MITMGKADVTDDISIAEDVEEDAVDEDEVDIEAEVVEDESEITMTTESLMSFELHPNQEHPMCVNVGTYKKNGAVCAEFGDRTSVKTMTPKVF